MFKKLRFLSVIALLHAASFAQAGDLGINVVLAGEVRPGVYGQVEIGNMRPSLLYERPVVIVAEERYRRAQPVYLHVPPGHAKNWSKHCHKYQACGRQVYFVRSEEYSPDYHSGHHHEEHHDREHHYEERHDREHHYEEHQKGGDAKGKGQNGHGQGKAKGKDKH